MRSWTSASASTDMPSFAHPVGRADQSSLARVAMASPAASSSRGRTGAASATLDWVAWFNTQRLLAPLGYLPPAEFEAQHYAAAASQVVQRAA